MQGEGRTAVFGHDEEDGAISEVDLEELEDLDEADFEDNGDSADGNFAGHSADDEQHPSSNEGQVPLGKGQHREGLRMDAADLIEPENDLEGSIRWDPAAGSLQWKGSTLGSRLDTLTRKRSQNGALASRAGIEEDVGKHTMQPAAVQPAMDMGRLLSRASAAAANAQQRRESIERASAKAAGGSDAVDADDTDAPSAAKGAKIGSGTATLQNGNQGCAQGVLVPAARQPKRAREEGDVSEGKERWEPKDQDGDQKSARSEEPQKERMSVKRGGKAGRGLFGAAMAGLNGKRTQ